MWIRAQTAKEYLERKITIVNDCWEFEGVSLTGGYVIINATKWAKQYNVTKAHQLSFIIYRGDYNRNMILCHTCNNRRCVNPDHLYVGTHKTNAQDRIRSGRSNSEKGATHHAAKLTDTDVYKIRQLLGQLSHVTIASLFGVGRGAISKIANNSRWKHLK